MNDLKEIRCKRCNKLLGYIAGKGEIKCPKSECGATNQFDTETGMHKLLRETRHVNLKCRKTSSGLRFG